MYAWRKARSARGPTQCRTRNTLCAVSRVWRVRPLALALLGIRVRLRLMRCAG
jgi:hypothetical protein